jgi:predicted enzyme related to lactoylglutathione lyase
VGSPVAHWQIVAKNPDRAVAFYKSVFGWTVNASNSMGYREVDTRSPVGIDGGIWPAPPEGQPMVTLYVEVDDIPDHVKRATDHGAKVIMPHQKLPDGDEMAVIIDPEGIPFGLMHRAAKPDERRSK